MLEESVPLAGQLALFDWDAKDNEGRTVLQLAKSKCVQQQYWVDDSQPMQEDECGGMSTGSGEDDCGGEQEAREGAPGRRVTRRPSKAKARCQSCACEVTRT